jgi:C1A family cysteine protease
MAKRPVKKKAATQALKGGRAVALALSSASAEVADSSTGSRAVSIGWNPPVPIGNPPVPILARHLQLGQDVAFPRLKRNTTLRVRDIEWYGWKPDLPDARDHLYAAPLFSFLPSKYDLRSQFRLPPVYDQGELGSCSGNAIAAAIQFERIRQKLAASARIPSRLFIYYNERVIERTIDSDSGAQIRDGIKSVASQGVCFETGADGWPYKIANFKEKPPSDCYKDALKDRVVSYSRLRQMPDQLKGCLASGYPFVFGFSVYESFESKAVEASGVVPMPASGEKPVGGHAVMAIGYDDASQRFTVRNSWGQDWGQQGDFTIPYSYLTNPGLAQDLWTIRLIAVSA